MASEWDAAALQVAGQLGATALNSYLVADANDKEREWALERYHEQLADQRENWNMVNEYNDPSNVMLRLAKAGLNPNLAITGITGASQAAQPVGKADVPSRHPNAPQFNMDALAIGNLISQIKLNQSQANKNNAEANLVTSQTTGQDLQNKFNEDTLSLREAMLSNENYKILRETSKIDNDILNDTLITQKNLQISDEQIKTLIQSRQVQWEELDLSKKQIGANIRQGFMMANAAIMQGRAAQDNAYANMIRATSESLRNSKLNELTDKQIGTMALENLRLQNDMQYDPDRHELESQKREAIYKRNEAWNKNFGWTGISFDDFRSLIPFTPSVEGSHTSLETGDKVKWKF